MSKRMVVEPAGHDHDHPHGRDAQDAAYKTEHAAAWALVAASVLLGAIGLLRGFGVLGDNATEVGQPGTQDPSFGALWDMAVWMLPAIAAAFLASALHKTDHHRMRDPARTPDDEEGFWKSEHALAYLMALASVAFAVLGMLVSFDVLGRGNDQPDGLPWLMASVAAAILANALHNVRHHQLAEEDYIVRVMERRGATRGTPVTGATTTEYGTGTTRT